MYNKSATEICPICGDSFALKYKLKDHMESKHAFKKDFQCEKCTDTFLSKPGLDIHRRVCTKIRRHKCSECSKSFKKMSHLKSHQDGYLDKKSYTCDKCTKTFLYSSSLNQHKLEKHEKPLSHVCEICSNSFSKKKWLMLILNAILENFPFLVFRVIKNIDTRDPLWSRLKRCTMNNIKRSRRTKTWANCWIVRALHFNLRIFQYF